MKIKLIISLLALSATLSVFSQKKVKLETRTDSVSYAIGISMFQATSQFNHPLDNKMIIKGFNAASENMAVMETEEAQLYVQTVSIEMSEIENKNNAAKGEKFLAENREKDGVIETASGLQYIIIKKGEGPVPLSGDRVKVHYSGYLLDGTKFDSSIDRGEPAVFGVTQVIPGWTEVLQLMPAGSEYKVFIPADLAYGDRQMGEDIKPGSLLIFDIQLLEVVGR